MQTTSVMHRVAVLAAVAALVAQTGYCQTNGGGFQAPLTNVTVTDDSLVLFFNTELFFLSVFAVDSAPYDSSIVGTEVQEGEDQVVMIPPPALGEHAAMLSFSPFGVFSFLGVVPSLTTQNFVATFSYYSTTQDIVFALNTDDIGGVTTDFFLLPQTDGEWSTVTVDMFQTFGDIPWFGFQFRNFVNEDRVFFVDEMILTVPLPPNTCNNQVDPSLCPCGPYSVLCGTAGADTIGGTNGCDCIYGFGGADIIYGNGGDDWIWAGAGNDVVFGGEGDDAIYGEMGFDTLYGNVGNDYLSGGDQADNIYGGNGDDRLFGELGNDRLYGEGNSDKIFGGDGVDFLYSGKGSDILQGGPGKDILVSEDSIKDTLNGGPLFDKAFISTQGCGKNVYTAVEKVINNNGKFLTNC